MSSPRAPERSPAGRAITVVTLVTAVALVLMAAAVRVASGLEVTDAAAEVPSELFELGRLAGARAVLLLCSGLALGWIGCRGAMGASEQWLLAGIGRVGVLTAVAALVSGMWVTSALAVGLAVTCGWAGRRTGSRAQTSLSVR